MRFTKTNWAILAGLLQNIEDIDATFLVRSEMVPYKEKKLIEDALTQDTCGECEFS